MQHKNRFYSEYVVISYSSTSCIKLPGVINSYAHSARSHSSLWEQPRGAIQAHIIRRESRGVYGWTLGERV